VFDVSLAVFGYAATMPIALVMFLQLPVPNALMKTTSRENPATTSLCFHVFPPF
jgi:hypothetical protein